MWKQIRVLLVALLVTALPVLSAHAANKADINSEVQVALTQLYESTPAAKKLSEKAKAILVFCPEPHEPGNDVSTRMFAEAYGITEDPATGSGNGCLAAYLVLVLGIFRSSYHGG